MDTLGQIDITPPLLGDVRERFDSISGPDSPWVLCRDGCCLRLEDDDRTLAAEWLDELVVELGHGHRFDGLVVVATDDGEIYTVRAVRNRVYDRVLRPTDGRRQPRGARVIDLQPRLQSRR